MIYPGSKSGIWETEDCYAKQAYICEIDPGVDVLVPENTAGLHTVSMFFERIYMFTVKIGFSHLELKKVKIECRKKKFLPI